MTELLKLSKAARLAGVTRKEIQSKIRSGELHTFEGEVKLTDVLRVFPQIDLDYDPTLEQMERIKANATAKFPWQQNELPSVEALLRRLQSLTGLLVKTKSALDHHVDLLADVSAQLDELAGDDDQDPAAQKKLRELHSWLAKNLDKPENGSNDAAIMFAKNLLLHIVSPSVQFVPSGHECLIEGGDSILDAALKSGTYVNYGCSDGSCGSCKARVISGQVLETRKPIHQLSELEKNMGYTLMCCNTGVTDLVLEAAEAARVSSLPEQSIKTKIIRLQKLNDETLLVHLKPARKQGFRYFAGQNATVTHTSGATMTLPMVSCPCDRDNLQFIVSKKHDASGARALFEALKADESIEVSGPSGDFVLFQGSTDRSLFICNDDGFPPIKSLIEHAISMDQIEAFHLCLFSSPDAPVYFHNLSRSWADAFDNFTYTQIAMPSPSATLEIPDEVLAFQGADAYIAGPQQMTNTIQNMLIKNGLHKDRVRTQTHNG